MLYATWITAVILNLLYQTRHDHWASLFNPPPICNGASTGADIVNCMILPGGPWATAVERDIAVAHYDHLVQQLIFHGIALALPVVAYWLSKRLFA
jgi:hypothetical protein